MGMKLFTGRVLGWVLQWVVAPGLVLASAAANAQMLAPGGPGPRLLPPMEVYTVLRENGFSPLGIPKQRGFVYTVSVIDRSGDDGRLVIDARTGRIVRFMPASRIGGRFGDAVAYGPPGPPPPVGIVRPLPPPFNDARAVPRPPRNVPKVANHTPSAAPPHAGDASPIAAKPDPAPVRQSAAALAEPQTTAQGAAPPQAAAPAIVEAKPSVEGKPAPQIAPTQDMPKVQGLE
jgi:hypothetical protein